MIKIIKWILIIVLFLPSLLFCEDREEKIIEIFHEYIKLNIVYLDSIHEGNSQNISCRELRYNLEKYDENVYEPILVDVIDEICTNCNSNLLREYFNVILHTRNSASEYPSIILGKIFLCKTDLFITELKKITIENRRIILKELDWGFKNIICNNKDDIPNYKYCENKLIELNEENN